MSSNEQIPILMLPGIASDHRIFGPQRQAFPNMFVPDRIEANSELDMVTVATQLLNQLLLGEKPCLRVERPYFIGGTSVGGALAIELAWLLQELGNPPLGVLLVSSCRSWEAVPAWYARWYQWSETLPRWFASKLFQNRLSNSLRGERVPPEISQLVRSMYLASDWTLLRNSVRLLSTWRRDAVDLSRAPFAVHQLHGRLDTIIPHPPAKEATLILDAGHWMSQTHPTAVNNWIAAIVNDAKLRLSRPGRRS